MLLRSGAGWRWSIATALVPAAIVCIALAAHPGIPAFRHDWHWPPYVELLRAYAFARLLAWNWTAQGLPNAALQAHPYYVTIAALSFLFSTKGTLLITMFGVVFAAGLGMARLCRSLFAADPLTMLASATLFTLSPFMVNQLVAGHLENIASCVALPWALVAANSRGRFAPWIFALAIAWSALHVQYLFLTLACTALLFGWEPFARSKWQLAACAGTLLPEIWALLLPATAQSTLQTTPYWLFVQSAPILQAVTGANYFAAYWQTAVSGVSGLASTQWLYPFGVLMALALRTRLSWRLILVYLVAVFLLWGEQGALSSVMTAALRAPVFSLFRELYHIAILIAAVSSIAMAAVLMRFISSARVIMAIGIVGVLAMPFVRGTVLGQTGSLYGSQAEYAMLQSASRAAQPAWMFLPPGFSPVGPRDATYGGVDPLAFTWGNALPLWDYAPRDASTVLIWDMNEGGTSAALAAVQRGIGLELRRPALESKLNPNVPYALPHVRDFNGAPKVPHGWSVRAQAAGESLVAAPEPNGLLELQKSIAQPVGTSVKPPVQIERGANPLEGWAPANDWWFLSRAVAAHASDGAISFAKHPPRLLCGVVQCLMEPDKASGAIISYPKTEAAVALPQRAGVLPLAALTFEGSTLRGRTKGSCHDCSLVLHVRFDPGWAAVIDGVRIGAGQECCGGNGIGWHGDFRPGSDVVVSYQPQEIATALLVVAFLSWLVLLSGAVLSGFRRPAIRTS